MTELETRNSFTIMEAPPYGSITSSGLFAHDDPLKHSLLLLIVQIVVILSFSRLMSFLLRPLRQPRVIAELISGILLGPTAFSRIHKFSDVVFPKSSLDVLQTVANFGLIFFLFLTGLELDLDVLRKTGRQAIGIAALGIVVPFALGIPVSLEIFKATGMQHTGEHFGLPFVLFIGVALSITAFPVLARILAERKIMATEVGQIAISAAAVNDVAAWVLLGLAVAVSNPGSSPLVVLWVLLAGFVYLGIMFFIIRPFVCNILAKDPVPEYAIAITFLLVLISSFATDAIGINVIFGAFIMGLIIPKDQPISGILIDKTEDYVSILLLPLYFTSSGLNVDLRSISNGTAVAAFLLVTATAVIGKVASTMMVAKVYGLGLRSSAALGFLMSAKGLVELIVLNIGLTKRVINKEIFSIMVLMALVTSIAATPMLMWLYKPARDLPPYKRRNLEAKCSDDVDKLRMLVCLYGMRNVPSMLNLVELSKGRHAKLFQVSALHLLEFSDRLGGIKMADALKASEPWDDGTDPKLDDAPVNDDALATSMRTFGEVNNIRVKVSRSVSRVSSMHEDICMAAVKSRASIIILPYHKFSRPDGTLQSAGTGFLQVNQRVLKESPCSVAMLFDRGLGPSTVSSITVQQPPHNHILILFCGGPDDREALWLAKRMADHSSVKLTIVQCIFKDCWSHCRPGTLDRLTLSSKELGRSRKSSSQLSKDWLMRWGRRSLRWLRNHDGQEAATPALQVNDSTDMCQSDLSGHSNGITTEDPVTAKPVEQHRHVPQQQSNGSHAEDDIQVAVGQLEQNNEKSLDETVLGHLLAAAASLPDRITVRALEMDALEELLERGEYGLIIVGLHSGRLDFQNVLQSISSSQSVTETTDHGLGSVGNWLISKNSVSTRSSLLVIWQHDRSCNESLERIQSKLKVSDSEVVHSVVVDLQESESPPQPVRPQSTFEVSSQTSSDH